MHQHDRLQYTTIHSPSGIRSLLALRFKLNMVLTRQLTEDNWEMQVTSYSNRGAVEMDLCCTKSKMSPDATRAKAASTSFWCNRAVQVSFQRELPQLAALPSERLESK